MAKQKIFKAGNSPVVSIPKQLYNDLNLRIGQEVRVERVQDSDGFAVYTVDNKVPQKSNALTKEFKKWLKKTVAEDKDILIELAHK